MSARNLFYSKGYKFSSSEERLNARETLIYNVTEDLLVILEDSGVTKKELASRLGKSPAYVSQILSGSRNMTLATLSDICFSLGFEPAVLLPVQPLESHTLSAEENGWEVQCGGYNSRSDRVKKSSGNIFYLDEHSGWAA